MIIEYREDKGEGWMCIEHSGIEVRHRLPGPFRVERIGSAAKIVNATGIDWAHIEGAPAAVFNYRDADEICRKLNGGKP